ncbi:MAG: BNR repeat-containing protein [Acidobacteriota bacterium]
MRRFLLLTLAALASAAEPEVARVIDVMPVWSGHTVGFDFLTHRNRQFIAFYDAERHMRVAARALGSAEWKFVRLPSDLKWDSHNYVTMAIDDQGYIHLSGNMHVVPLVYFRTTRPLDIETFERIPAMVGPNEDRCTYPHFLRGSNNEFLFTYRDGRSGAGNQIYNVYEHKTRSWRRLHDAPLSDGRGKMNAYFIGPVKGPDGCFHLCWVWRDHGGCETNHDLSYARSRDLVHWETSSGKPVPLPMTIETAEIVDPAPVRGGMINGNTRIGFDSAGRVILTYHKFDARGITQAYTARLEGSKWVIRQTSQWSYRWDFQGGGAIPFEIRIGSVHRDGKGNLLLDYQHVKEGEGVWVLDEKTLKPVGQREKTRAWPKELERPESDFPGIAVRLLPSAGSSGARYVLRWETLGPNRDRPREGPLPPPSMLRVYELR